MKINWGGGIVIAIALFMSFILYMVITMMTDKRYDFDLVVENYYQYELGYQDNLDARNRAAQLTNTIEIVKNNKGVTLLFPEDIVQNIQEGGEVYFYRLNDKSQDFKLPLDIKNNAMTIPDAMIESGRWDLTITWVMNNQEYILVEKITY